MRTKLNLLPREGGFFICPNFCSAGFIKPFQTKNTIFEGLLTTTYKILLAKAKAGDSEAQYLLAMA